MRRLHDKYFVCSEGHVTCGDTKKDKCDAELWQLNYIKGKRKGQWKEAYTKAGKCGQLITEQGEIPEIIHLDQVWDYTIMHAFLLGQKFDAEFMIALQNEFKRLWDKVNEKNEKKEV